MGAELKKRPTVTVREAANFLGMTECRLRYCMRAKIIDIGIVVPGKRRDRYYIFPEKLKAVREGGERYE